LSSTLSHPFKSKVFLTQETPIDPLKIMKIKSSPGNGEKGGRFGCGRIWPSGDPNAGKPKPHRGLDLEADTITFMSIYSGEITKIDKVGNTDWGKYIIIKSPQNNVSILYMHLNEIDTKWKVKDLVKQGDVLGLTGDSGEAKGNPHLHIEVSPTFRFDDKCRLDRDDPENHIKTKFSPPNTNKPLKTCNCHLPDCKTPDCN
jgi:murein DD-endopeptidase MepM/ murein hydrolase activator NlpD